MLDLDGVTDGVDIGVARAQMLVHLDTVGGTDHQTGALGKLRVRAHADREHDHICRKLHAAGQGYRQGPVGVPDERLDAIAQMHLDAVCLQFLMGIRGHVRIEETENLGQHLDERDIDLLLPQVLRYFDADEAAANDDRLLRAGMDRLDNAVHVRDHPQRVDSLVFDTLDGRTQR